MTCTRSRRCWTRPVPAAPVAVLTATSWRLMSAAAAVEAAALLEGVDEDMNTDRVVGQPRSAMELRKRTPPRLE